MKRAIMTAMVLALLSSTGVFASEVDQETTDPSLPAFVQDSSSNYIENVKFSKDFGGNYVSFRLNGPIAGGASQSNRFYLKIFYNKDQYTDIYNASAGGFLNQTCGLASYYLTTTYLGNGTAGGIGGIYMTDSWRQSGWTNLDILATNFPYDYKIYFPEPVGCLGGNPDLKNAVLTPEDFLSISIEGWFRGNIGLQYKYVYPERVYFEPEVTKDPVLIVPGIMGTYLNKDYDDYGEIWPDIQAMISEGEDLYLADLALETDGIQDATLPIIVREIIKEEGPLGFKNDVFKGLIGELTGAGYTKEINILEFPFDWRYDVAQVVGNLNRKISDSIVSSNRQQVNIISHSMGGSVSKQYLSTFDPSKVGKLVFLGSPHIGSPKSFKVLAHGDDMGMRKFGVGLNPRTVKVISQNMPSVYQLLPSRKYVEDNPYLVDLASSFLDFDNPPSTTPLDYDATKNFLIESGRNELMFPMAESLHDDIDDMSLDGIETYNIVGCGTPTLGKITATKKIEFDPDSGEANIVDDFRLGYVDGDGTVPSVSAAHFNAFRTYFVNKADHGTLPSSDGVRQLIAAILENGGDNFSFEDYPNIRTDSSVCSPITGNLVSSHSPVELHVYDDSGNHTGPLPNGDVEYGIPEVTYDTIENAKFAFLPEGGRFKVVNTATDIGSFDFLIEKVVDTSTEEIVVYEDIPLETLETKSEIVIESNQLDFSINLDKEGDGEFESIIQPSSIVKENEAQDLIRPRTELSVSGSMKKGYFIKANVTLNATDDNSGVLKTLYSVDGSSIWEVYSEPFVLNTSGEISVKYFSIDRAGNNEPIREKVVRNIGLELTSYDGNPTVITP